MPTIKVNRLTLSHKGSQGFSVATLPDVCKTPSPGGPVPVPYPNISRSRSLRKGSKTVRADGHMISIKGSHYSSSTGDEPGTLGGVKSGTVAKESTWITCSMDVKIEGQGACRLTDKKFQNHGNTVDMAGDMEPYIAATSEIVELLCKEFCKVLKEGKEKGEKWTAKLMERLKGNDKLKKMGLRFEKQFLVRNVTGKAAQTLGRKAVKEATYRRLKSMAIKKLATLPAKAIPVIGWLSAAYDIYEVVRIIPDVVSMLNGRVTQAFDFKFPGDKWGPGQEKLYEELAGQDPILIDENECDCKNRL